MARPRPALAPDALMRVLVRVQSDLAGDLGLAALASEARLSRAHFQRAFSTAAGVSPSAFVARVRCERAAYLMQVRDASLLEIALDVGFENPDTFTRAFRRRFGAAPGTYRRRAVASAELIPVSRHPAVAGVGFSLSPTRVVRMREMRVAFLRHVGPYENVDPDLWVRLVAWARAEGVTHGWCLGIGHDAPGITAPSDLRFDAGILVPGAVEPSRGVGVQTLPAGLFAVTRHAGPYATLPSAYPEIFTRASALRGHRLVGLPVIEVYHDATIDTARPLSVTDVHLPVVEGVLSKIAG